MSKKLKKKEIGLGIRALLSKVEDQETTLPSEAVSDLPQGIKMIPLEVIEANPDQPRQEFNKETLLELSESIKTFGLIQPITLRKISSNSYQVISGERRVRASKLAGILEVPAYIRTANDQELLEMGLVENIQREDLNAMDIALSYHRLIEECHLTHDEMSKRIGKKRSTISNYVRLLKLAPEIQKALKKGLISMGHARALAGLEFVDQQLVLCDKAIRQSWSVRQLEDAVGKIGAVSKSRTAPSNESSQEIMIIQGRLKKVFGTKVIVQHKKSGNGKIEVHFDSTDQLNDLIELMEEMN